MSASLRETHGDRLQWSRDPIGGKDTYNTPFHFALLGQLRSELMEYVESVLRLEQLSRDITPLAGQGRGNIC